MTENERWENGIYMLADTPRTWIPLLTESGDGDFQLLKEYLHENGFKLNTRELDEFVTTIDYLTDCDKCSRPLSNDECHEFGHGTYCEHCADPYYEEQEEESV